LQKSRLETFSDGVFAIAITLLVLNIRIPQTDYEHLLPTLLAAWPQLLGYVMSFVIVSVYWVSHHNLFHLIRKVDHPSIWMNLLLLLFIGFIPFPTALMGQFPFKQMPVIIYCSTLLATNLIGFICWKYAANGHRLIDPNVSRATIRRIDFSFFIVNLFYLLAIGVSFFSPAASYVVLGLNTLLIILRKPAIEV